MLYPRECPQTFRRMLSNIPGNVAKHSEECRQTFPGNVTKHSRECCQTFDLMEFVVQNIA